MDPDHIVNRGITTLQQKLATVIKELSGDKGLDGQDFGGAQSPNMTGAGGYGGADGGYTPAGGYGGGSTWGGAGAGAATPYGATTPYGQSW